MMAKSTRDPFDDTLKLFECLKGLSTKSEETLLYLLEKRPSNMAELAKTMVQQQKVYEQVMKALRVIEPDIAECIEKDSKTLPSPPKIFVTEYVEAPKAKFRSNDKFE